MQPVTGFQVASVHSMLELCAIARSEDYVHYVCIKIMDLLHQYKAIDQTFFKRWFAIVIAMPPPRPAFAEAKQSRYKGLPLELYIIL